MRKTTQAIVIIALFSGCGILGRTSPKRADPAQLPDYTHTVRYSGETLSAISLWYTGSVNNWQLLSTHNGIAPRQLQIGSKVRIPETMIYRSKPMPRQLAKASRRRTRPTTSYSRASLSRSLSENRVAKDLLDGGEGELASEALRARLMDALLECQTTQASTPIQ